MQQHQISQNMPIEEIKEAPILHSGIHDENMKNEVPET